jgi:hypothetical protein
LLASCFGHSLNRRPGVYGRGTDSTLVFRFRLGSPGAKPKPLFFVARCVASSGLTRPIGHRASLIETLELSPSASRCDSNHHSATSSLVMAEGLVVIGLVSVIAQLADFATKVVDRLNEFHSSLNEVPQIFRDIKNQLPLLILTLEDTQSRANARRISEETAEKLKHGVSGCLSQVKRLEDIMAKTIPAERDSTLNRRLKALASLAHEKTVQHIRSEVDRYALYLTCYNSSPFLNNLSTWESSQRKPVFTVKFDRDPSFIGREDIIKEIDERFKARQRRVAIAGIGGVG